MRFPALCNPWKADGFFSFHVTMSERHTVECRSSFARMLVAPMSHQWLVMAIFFQRDISGHVLVRNCGSVLAVIVARASSQVSRHHEFSMEMRSEERRV